MRKAFKVLAAFAALSVLSALAADDVIVPKDSGKAYVKTNSGDLWPLGVMYTTDGSGNILTLGGQTLVADNLKIQKDTGKVYLLDNASRLFPATIIYTTDGSGNVIPVPAGGGGGGTVRTANSVSMSFTIPSLSTDYVLNVNTSSAGVSVTLPDAVAGNSFCVEIKNTGSPVHDVTVIPPGSQKIDGASSKVIDGQYDALRMCAVSGNWFIY